MKASDTSSAVPSDAWEPHRYRPLLCRGTVVALLQAVLFALHMHYIMIAIWCRAQKGTAEHN